MISSAARIAANRRNALKSTGPKTPEGKDAARRNALKHGLTAATLATAEDAPAFESRAASFRQTLRPASDYHAWLVDEIAATTLRLDRARRMERQLRDDASFRALTCWDDDQRRAAERLGAALDRRPAAVVADLRATPQGIDWLIARWDLLAEAAARHPWTAEESRRAAHLLGTPTEADAEVTPTDSDVVHRATTPIPAEGKLARDAMAELRDLRGRMAEADDIARATVAAGLGDMGQPDLARLRRYERDLQRRLRWCHDRLRDDPAGRGASTQPRPAPVAHPTPEPGPIPPPPAPPVAAAPPAAPGRNEPTAPPVPDETKPPAPPGDPRLGLNFDLDLDAEDMADYHAWLASLEGLAPDRRVEVALDAARDAVARSERRDHPRRPDLKKAFARRDRGTRR